MACCLTSVVDHTANTDCIDELESIDIRDAERHKQNVANRTAKASSRFQEEWDASGQYIGRSVLAKYDGEESGQAKGFLLTATNVGQRTSDPAAATNPNMISLLNATVLTEARDYLTLEEVSFKKHSGKVGPSCHDISYNRVSDAHATCRIEAEGEAAKSGSPSESGGDPGGVHSCRRASGRRQPCR